MATPVPKTKNKAKLPSVARPRRKRRKRKMKTATSTRTKETGSRRSERDAKSHGKDNSSFTGAAKRVVTLEEGPARLEKGIRRRCFASFIKCDAAVVVLVA